MSLIEFIRKYFGWSYRPIKKALNDYKATQMHIKDALRLDLLSIEGKPRLYYLGITSHSNLGDMAQHYCICKWIDENYSDYDHVLFESNTVVDSKSGFMEKFLKLYRHQDIIVFQSGYTTQDLGGNHEQMHRLIIDNIPEAKILMMPQTIYFEHEKNKIRTAKSYDKAKHMLFLARDFVSYDMAKKMFPHIEVKAFPDIVTTLIGTLNYNNVRNGICLCRRDDSEKYYSEEELINLKIKLETVEPVSVTDTTIKVSFQEIRANKQKYIEGNIEKFSHFKVTITDRYHGTIFSLAAGTPVIIIKTTDHKVTTGADWFKGVYDKYVYVAEDLNDAYYKAIEVCNEFEYSLLSPYFNENYYKKLKDFFEKTLNK